MTKGYYQSIESFALVDGPGVRSVLFLTGCPFRCLFCHNPDTWEFDPKNVITPEEALKKLIRYKTYWKDNGGITISGGEPLMQQDFLIEFCRLAKAENINITIDT
jgi:pyruvate formate lyase activating enzyme